MFRALHRLLLPAALLLFSATALSGQEHHLLGVFQSPKGVGVSVLTGRDAEMNIFTLRTDFCGVLSGRTPEIGAVFSLHAGAGVMAGWVHDFEKGVFSIYDRGMTHSPGIAVGAAGNIGLRADFARHITLDLSFSVFPGIHLRTNKSTGALITSFYKAGLYHAYYPQLNLFYRF